MLHPGSPPRLARRAPLPLAATLILSLAIAAVATAQDAPGGRPAPTAGTIADELVLDTVDVPRVLVDLVVETRGGDPVLDLRREEVRVYEDDQPVEILGWSAPGEQRSWQEGEDRDPQLLPTAGTAAPRVFVLMLDELHLHPPNKKKVLRQIRQVAQELVGGGATVLFAAWDGDLRLIQPATRDAEALKRAIDDEIKADRFPMQALLADPAQAMSVIQDRMRDNTQDRGSQPTTVVGRPEGNDPCVDVGGLARTHAQQAASAAGSSLAGLTRMVASLSVFSGRKSLLLISDGIPLVPGLDVYTYAMEMCDGTAARAGLDNAVDTQDFGSGRNTRWDPRTARTEAMDFDTTRQWRDITAYANAQQVSIYPVQASGLQGLRSAGVQDLRTTSSLAQTADGNLRDALTLAATQTGGATFFDSNQFGDAVLEAVADAGAVYELSFAPTNPGDGRSHEIRVEVDRPGVKARHRRSYRALPPSAWLESRVFATLLHGDGDNPLDARVVPSVAEPAEKGETRVTVQVFVPLSRLTMIPAGVDRRGRFTVAVGGRQGNGRFLDIGLKQIDVLASEVDVASQAFLYEVEVPFRSDRLALSVAIRDELGGQISTLRREVAAVR
ncbi:MAG TPA: VWA domain-containing protein [Thermoanaerobaculia bacterium]|nr:VWA domain-containing protein [Thermoanaerobaculia bacterium]